MRFFDHTENTIVNLNADDFADYMLSDFHVMECMVDNLSAVCDYFDKVAKFNKKSLMIPDSLYLDMMIDISFLKRKYNYCHFLYYYYNNIQRNYFAENFR